MEKNFWRPAKFFRRSCPCHIFEPLVPRKPTKLSGARKVFFCDPVPVTYSNPWSHKSRKNLPRFFLRSCPRHIFEPLVPQKPTKLSGAPIVIIVLLRTHTLGQTPTSQPDLPTLIISCFNLNSPEVSFRIPKAKLRPPKYYDFTRKIVRSSCAIYWAHVRPDLYTKGGRAQELQVWHSNKQPWSEVERFCSSKHCSRRVVGSHQCPQGFSSFVLCL